MDTVLLVKSVCEKLSRDDIEHLLYVLAGDIGNSLLQSSVNTCVKFSESDMCMFLCPDELKSIHFTNIRPGSCKYIEMYSCVVSGIDMKTDSPTKPEFMLYDKINVTGIDPEIEEWFIVDTEKHGFIKLVGVKTYNEQESSFYLDLYEDEFKLSNQAHLEFIDNIGKDFIFRSLSTGKVYTTCSEYKKTYSTHKCDTKTTSTKGNTKTSLPEIVDGIYYIPNNIESDKERSLKEDSLKESLPVTVIKAVLTIVIFIFCMPLIPRIADFLGNVLLKIMNLN